MPFKKSLKKPVFPKKATPELKQRLEKEFKLDMVHKKKVKKVKNMINYASA